jgi:hypothetical protein
MSRSPVPFKKSTISHVRLPGKITFLNAVRAIARHNITHHRSRLDLLRIFDIGTLLHLLKRGRKVEQRNKLKEGRTRGGEGRRKRERKQRRKEGTDRNLNFILREVVAVALYPLRLLLD